MFAKKYQQLVHEFCALSGIAQPETVLRERSVMIDEVVFSIVHDEKHAPAVLSVYADLGALPARREQEMCVALMEANLFLFAAQGPVLGISPQTRQITMASRYPLESLTAATLRDAMKQIVVKAKEWRATHFLDALKPAVRSPGRGVFHALRTPV